MLAEQEPGEDRAEQGDEMQHGASPHGPDQLDAAVPGDIGDEARKDRGISEDGERRQIGMDDGAGQVFVHSERQRHQR